MDFASPTTVTRSPVVTYPEQRETQQTSPVLLVDATGHHKSPDLAEVPVVTGIIKSPVRVVCHSPRSMGRNRNGLENSSLFQRSDNVNTVTGHVESGRRVKVAGVPSVNLLDSSARKGDPSPSHFSPDSLASEHSIGDSPLDHESLATETRIAEQRQTRDASQFKSFLGEEGYQPPPLSSNLSTSEIKQQLFDFSLVPDVSSQTGDGDQSNILPGDEKPNSKLKKKKQKTARIVPSRYMEKAKITKKAAGKEVALPTKKKAKAQTAAPKSRDQSLIHSHSYDSGLNLGVNTPFVRHTSQKKGLVTSTPADGMVGVDPPAHMAAPTPILPQGIPTSTRVHGGGAAAVKKVARDKSKSQAAVVTKKQAVKSTGSSQAHSLQADHVTTKPPVPSEVGHTSSEMDQDISQRQLELQYSRVVQAAFLYSRLKHSFSQKEKDAQVQMYSVWQEKEKLQREVANLELQLKMKTKIAELDKQIQLQMSGLKPIGTNMLKLILEYSKLAAALDTTRHHMSVNGVFLPDNHDELFAVLDESERLLGEIDELTKHKQQKVDSFAKEMEGLSKTVESEIQEQKRCGELLAAASTLSTQERSLQAQTIMAGL
ncbi:unnamed protein product [Porites evermanni]|uniref:HAUS augmin-like complex subunit 8 n=1 Tax=Porites evermanni TaxID=104178 RepID=A0ABN8R843_9CNID|nr:unnamed protein product [Porites evermanni]